MREIHKDDTIHCVEFEPQCRTLRMLGRFRYSTEREYNQYYLSLPYMQFTTILRKVGSDYYGSQYKSFHATFSNKPLKSIKSPAFLPLLPNIYPVAPASGNDLDYCTARNCQVCLSYDLTSSMDLNAMISHFFQSGFTPLGDWNGCNLLEKTKALKTYLIWSEKTQEDPSFITKVKWPLKVKISNFPKLPFRSACSQVLR